MILNSSEVKQLVEYMKEKDYKVARVIDFQGETGMEAMCPCESYRIEFKKISYDLESGKAVEDIIEKKIKLEHGDSDEDHFLLSLN